MVRAVAPVPTVMLVCRPAASYGGRRSAAGRRRASDDHPAVRIEGQERASVLPDPTVDRGPRDRVERLGRWRPRCASSSPCRLSAYGTPPTSAELLRDGRGRRHAIRSRWSTSGREQRRSHPPARARQRSPIVRFVPSGVASVRDPSAVGRLDGGRAVRRRERPTNSAGDAFDLIGRRPSQRGRGPDLDPIGGLASRPRPLHGHAVGVAGGHEAAILVVRERASRRRADRSRWSTRPPGAQMEARRPHRPDP